MKYRKHEKDYRLRMEEEPIYMVEFTWYFVVLIRYKMFAHDQAWWVGVCIRTEGTVVSKHAQISVSVFTLYAHCAC